MSPSGAASTEGGRQLIFLTQFFRSCANPRLQNDTEIQESIDRLRQNLQGMCSHLSAKRSLSIQPKISWCLSAQWSPKHQNKHGSTRPDLDEKFLPSQDLLKSKAGFTETPASYATSTPEQKTQKSQNSQIKRVIGEIKMFHCLSTGWIRAKRCASLLISQIRCCSSSIHGLYFIFPFFFPLSFKCKPHCLSNTEGKVSSW